MSESTASPLAHEKHVLEGMNNAIRHCYEKAINISQFEIVAPVNASEELAQFSSFNTIAASFNCTEFVSFFSIIGDTNGLHKIASQMLPDMELDRADILDASQEFLNMLIGQTKLHLSNFDYRFQISKYKVHEQYTQWTLNPDESIAHKLLVKIKSAVGTIYLEWREVVKELGTSSPSVNQPAQEGGKKLIKVDFQAPENSTGIYHIPGFLPIAMNELVVDRELLFDVYMFFPTNQKVLLFRAKNESMDAKTMTKFKNMPYNVFYFPEKQRTEFIDYTSHQLKSIASNKALSKSQRKEYLTEKTISLLQNIYQTPDQLSGEKIDQLATLNQDFIYSMLEEKDPYKEILKLLKTSGSIDSHSYNCQALCTFFAIGLGYTNEKALSDLGIAALLHDIGLSVLDPACTTTPPLEMDKKTTEIYQKHTIKSLEMIDSKDPKLVSIEARMIIQQHHENYDGSGFPIGMKSLHLYPMSKIFAIVDEIDHLMIGNYTKTPMTLAQAIKYINEQWGQNGTSNKQRFDKKFIDNVNKLFLSQYKKAG